jgi:hypothetical protein
MDGSVFQAILLAFVFMAYLILVFVIVGDLMRDHELSGWWKAVWIVALILIPWLTGLLYIIVRGKGMAQRSATRPRASRRRRLSTSSRCRATTTPRRRSPTPRSFTTKASSTTRSSPT